MRHIKQQAVTAFVTRQKKAFVKKFHRQITAPILTMLYILIALTPLSPVMLKSARIAHAVSGECSGDCDIDGCSLESRANKTCCCWQKKLKQAGLQPNAATKACCASPAVAPPAPTSGCCSMPAPVAPPSSRCCSLPPSLDGHPDIESMPPADLAAQSPEPTDQPVYKCGTPCGRGNSLALLHGSTDEIIPFYFMAALKQEILENRAPTFPPHLISRSIEPPEPPPKLPTLS